MIPSKDTRLLESTSYAVRATATYTFSVGLLDSLSAGDYVEVLLPSVFSSTYTTCYYVTGTQESVDTTCTVITGGFKVVITNGHDVADNPLKITVGPFTNSNSFKPETDFSVSTFASDGTSLEPGLGLYELCVAKKHQSTQRVSDNYHVLHNERPAE